MPSLLVMRHAKAARPPATPDVDRDLTDRGRAEARDTGLALAARGVMPDLAVVSPAVRTRRTWQLVAPAFGREIPMTTQPCLYGGDVATLIDVVRRTDDGVATLLLCGHEPVLTALVLDLTGDLTGDPAGSGPSAGSDADPMADGLRTGAVAVLQAHDPATTWTDTGRGDFTLVDVLSPAR